MKTRLGIIDVLTNLSLFGVLFYGTFLLFPYVATNESYTQSRGVRDSFPIATIDGVGVEIVKWRQYGENPSAFSNKLLLAPSEGGIVSSEYDRFVIEVSNDNVVHLTLFEEDYTFWSEYSVENGIVHPRSYRFTGAFVVFYCFIAAFVGTPVVSWLFRKLMGPAVAAA